ncbi:MAG: ADP-ribosylglycohydrolase family protein [Malacoplasma sp.]
MSKIKDSLIGFAIGDAMGVPIEFSKREKLIAKPVTKMCGFGSHNVPAGCWSDDTSMTIATMDSFIEKQQFNYNDIMNKFVEWVVHYKYTPCNFRFDIGNTCFEAIYNYNKKDMKPIECGLKGFNDNGNGSLMRILPVALYSFYKKLTDEEVIQLVNDISSLTHAHEVSRLGCYIYTRYIIFLLNGKDTNSAYNMIKAVDYSNYSTENLKVYDRLLKFNIKELSLNEISSSAYVVNTLEASIWVLLNTKSYSQAIIDSINLGNDTDTIGAICGSMAGIVYGYESIPKEWLNKLVKREYLEEIADKFEKELN